MDSTLRWKLYTTTLKVPSSVFEKLKRGRREKQGENGRQTKKERLSNKDKETQYFWSWEYSF